jgi:hypothetical protein
MDNITRRSSISIPGFTAHYSLNSMKSKHSIYYSLSKGKAGGSYSIVPALLMTETEDPFRQDATCTSGDGKDTCTCSGKCGAGTSTCHCYPG